MAYTRRKLRFKRKPGARVYNNRRKKYQRKQATTVPMGMGFPKKIVMTHKYVEQVALTSTLGVIGKYQFSCNGLYDPNITGTGHQPYYFDEVTNLYNHYTVIGARAKFTVTPSVTNEDGFYFGCYIDDDNTTTNIGDITAVAEQTIGKIHQFSPNANETKTFYINWSAKKTFGGSVLGNDALQGSISGNPSEQSFFTLANQGFGANTTFCTVLVEITYTAVWEEIKNVAQS